MCYNVVLVPFVQHRESIICIPSLLSFLPTLPSQSTKPSPVLYGSFGLASYFTVLLVKKPSAMKETQEMWVQSLGQEDPQEEEITHSGILAWGIPWTESPAGCSP